MVDPSQQGVDCAELRRRLSAVRIGYHYSARITIDSPGDSAIGRAVQNVVNILRVGVAICSNRSLKDAVDVTAVLIDSKAKAGVYATSQRPRQSVKGESGRVGTLGGRDARAKPRNIVISNVHVI